MKYSEPYHGAVAMQRLLLNDAKDPTTEPSVRANIARAYATLEELKRLMRMKPSPKPVDVSSLVKRKAGPVEPSFTEQ